MSHTTTSQLRFASLADPCRSTIVGPAWTSGIAAQRLLAAMRTALGTERIYVCSFGETVNHLHFHLLPRDFAAAEAEDAAERVRSAL